MTEVLYSAKIKPEHLARKAIVYLRQSSERQMRQNKESQLLQYAVAERAARPRIVVGPRRCGRHWPGWRSAAPTQSHHKDRRAPVRVQRTTLRAALRPISRSRRE